MSAFTAVVAGIMLAATLAMLLAVIRITRWDGKSLPPAVSPLLLTVGVFELALALAMGGLGAGPAAIAPGGVGVALLGAATVIRRVKGIWR